MVFKNIQALRALAANGVVLSHLLTVEGKYGHGFVSLPDWAHLGSCGVDLFFVISGFIMATVASGMSGRAFLFARITRIYPPYWFYTLLVFALSCFAPNMVNGSYDHPASVWRSFLLLPDSVGPLLAVGWTLIHEMYFYIGFAVILAIGLPPFWALVGWAGIVGLLRLAFRDSLSPTGAVIFHPLTIEFIAGALIGFAVKKKWNRGAWPALLLGGVFLGGVLSLADDPVRLVDGVSTWRHVALLGFPFALIVYGAAGIELNGTRFAGRLGVLLGDASYSVYLSHVLVLSALGRIFSTLPDHSAVLEAGFVLFALLASNGAGWLSRCLIEVPLTNISRRLVPFHLLSAPKRRKGSRD